LIFLLFLRLPLVSTLVPYTTLFRSSPQAANRMLHPFDKKNMDLLFCLCGVPASTETQPPAAAALSSQGYCHGGRGRCGCTWPGRSEEHTSELQSRENLVCRLLLEKK